MLNLPQVMLVRAGVPCSEAGQPTDVEVTRLEDGTYDFRLRTADGAELAFVLDALLANNLWSDLTVLLTGPGQDDALDFGNGPEVD